MFHAYLILTNGWKDKNAKFNKLNSSFFREPITRTTELTKYGEVDGYNADVIRFFTGDAEQRDVLILWSLANSLPEDDEPYLIGAKIANRTEFAGVSKMFWCKPSIENHAEIASMFVRGSKALTINQYSEHGKLKYVADGDSFAVIGDELSVEDRALRVCYELSLAMAYQDVLDSFINQLSTAAVSTNNHAEYVLKRLASFISAYYFRNPVEMSTKELCIFYGAYRDRLQLNEQCAEVESQLKLLAEVVRIERMEEQSKSDKQVTRKLGRISFWVGFFGVVIAIAGLMPTVIKDTYLYRTFPSLVEIAQKAEMAQESKKIELSETQDKRKKKNRKRQNDQSAN